MDIISVDQSDISDFEIELHKAGVPFTAVKEERYFGDAHTVSVVIDIVKGVLTLLPPLLAFLSSRNSNRIVINGVEIKVSNPLTDDDKERIRRALN